MLDRLSWVFQRGLIWPIQDRLALDGAGRGLAFAAAIVLAAGAGVAGLLLVAPDKPNSSSAQPVAVSQPLADTPVPPVVTAAAPTLQGAAPVFEPGKDGNVARGKAVEAGGPASTQPADPTSAAAASEKVASGPSSSSTATAAKASNASGPAAGPAAVAVAREFADAFVLYETGSDKASVRRAFGATASPQLSRSLLRRPPRLPAKVEVPQAKVVNVVAGPSRGGIYTVSVALLRVGLTSELRLDMEREKGKRWLVTNVLG